MQASVFPAGPLRTGHLLVEPANNIGAHALSSLLPMHACIPATLMNGMELMPRLIDLAGLTLDQQESLAQIVRDGIVSKKAPLVCAWLHSRLDTDALGRHIARFLSGDDANGRPLLWRYYDPRVLPVALQLMSSTQQTALLGPILEWRFAWAHRYWKTSGPGYAVDVLGGHLPAWPTPQQWAGLRHCELIDKVMMQLCANATDSDCLRYLKEIGFHLNQAQTRWRLTGQQELADYALYCLRYGDAFRHHPKLSRAWQQLGIGEINWDGLLAMLDSRDFDQLQLSLVPRKSDTGASS